MTNYLLRTIEEFVKQVEKMDYKHTLTTEDNVAFSHRLIFNQTYINLKKLLETEIPKVWGKDV